MAIENDKFIMVDREHDRGIALDEYNGKYSLVAGYIDKNGSPAMNWCFRQDYDKEAKKSIPGKSMPIKIELGDKTKAISVLHDLMRLLGVPLPKDEDLSDVPF
jgi:hypothetical protein